MYIVKIYRKPRPGQSANYFTESISTGFPDRYHAARYAAELAKQKEVQYCKIEKVKK